MLVFSSLASASCTLFIYSFGCVWLGGFRNRFSSLSVRMGRVGQVCYPQEWVQRFQRAVSLVCGRSGGYKWEIWWGRVSDRGVKEEWAAEAVIGVLYTGDAWQCSVLKTDSSFSNLHIVFYLLRVPNLKTYHTERMHCSEVLFMLVRRLSCPVNV